MLRTGPGPGAIKPRGAYFLISVKLLPKEYSGKKEYISSLTENKEVRMFIMYRYLLNLNDICIDK